MADKDSQSYISARDSLVLKAETVGGKPNTKIYLDHRGIPTIGIGNALIVDVGKKNSPIWKINTDAINALGQATGLPISESVLGTLNAIKTTLQETPEPDYEKDRVTSGKFYNTLRGMKIQEALGYCPSGWDILRNRGQALHLTSRP